MGHDFRNLPLPPGFKGLRSDLPLAKYVRHLPHWRQDGATYFVTFRLADSLPQTKLVELRSIKEDWERTHTGYRSDEDWEMLSRETTRRAEAWLDQGFGSCVLGDERVAKIVVDSLHKFDNDRYELICYVLMPNHVHLIIKPLNPKVYPLEAILQSWKTWTSRCIHLEVGGEGELWQQESFDRVIRDEEHLYRCIQYIGRNPRNAGRSRERCYCWIRPEWEQLGWKFEDEMQNGP